MLAKFKDTLIKKSVTRSGQKIAFNTSVKILDFN